MRFIMVSILVLVSAINAYAGVDQKTLSTESRLYKQALAKLVTIPKDYDKTITSILKNGWKEDTNIIKLITDNLASLELFKKATLEISDGYIFARQTNQFDISSGFTDYYKHMQLFKLLLLEGKLNQIKGLQKEAEEDYLAATRFMVQVSQQRYEIMISRIINCISLDLACSYLEESPLNDTPYRNNLLNNLKKLRDNQDFLESAFKEEAKLLKNDARMLEEAAKKGANFEELFRISAIDGSDKEQINKYWERSKELTAMLDRDFFAEFYKQIDSRNDEFTSVAILGARENNGEIYERKFKDFHDSIDKLGKPLNYLLLSLGGITVEGKNVKLVVADMMANVFLIMNTPDFSKTIKKYWSFYNKLNILIDKVAEKDNKK